MPHPTLKISELLEKWQLEPTHSTDDISKFATELWISLADYEKKIKESIKGHEIIMAKKDYKYMSTLEWIKNKFGFYVEIYEVSINKINIISASNHNFESESKKRN